MKKIVFIFRRDLRIDDNIGWNKCQEYARKYKCKVVSIFVYNNKQCKKNDYFSVRSFDMLRECISNLQTQIHVDVYNENDPILHELLRNATKIFYNCDVTPFASKRDERLQSLYIGVCVPVKGDYTFFTPGSILVESTGEPYKIYGPFYRKVKHRLIGVKPKPNNKLRTKAIRLLTPFAKTSKRDSKIGAYLKYGVLSVREAYHIVRSNKTLVKQLIWREFFYQLHYAFPEMLRGQVTRYANKPYHNIYKKFEWSNSKTNMRSWTNGTTGFPIIDAAMRELKYTGYIPNQYRLIVASFLIKDLHIQWQKGEKYFAQQLIDYDPCQNNSGWQWVSGTGPNNQPWFRVYNPWTQSKKTDPECTYIKKWIPELQKIPCGHIHEWYKYHNKHITTYSKPIVNHDEQKKKYIQQMRQQ